MKVLLMLLVIVLACGENEDTDKELINTVIVPGLEAVGIKLGDDLDRVMELYGEPRLDFRPEWYNSNQSFLWTVAYDWSDIGLTVYFNDAGRAIEIGVRNPEARTIRGLGVGSTLDEVHKEYGDEEDVASGQGGVIFGDGGASYSDSYDARGIEFRYKIRQFIVVQVVVFDRE